MRLIVPTIAVLSQVNRPNGCVPARRQATIITVLVRTKPVGDWMTMRCDPTIALINN
jgi:hypothetical protein